MAELTIDQAFHAAQQHHKAGQLAQAEAIYRQILALQPNHADALHYLGLIAHQVGRPDVAAELMRKSISIKPHSAESHGNLGNVLYDMGQLDEAISTQRQAIALRGNYPEAYNNLGNALAGSGKLDDAIAAYHRAIALQPDYPDAFSNLGNALTRKGQMDEAIAAYRQAINLRPSYAEAHTNLGNAFKETGRPEDAVAAFRQALTLRPDSPQAHSNLVYSLLFHLDYDGAAIGTELKAFNRRFAEPLRGLIKPHTNSRDPERRLRIGYVSPDLREHVVGRNLLPLFEKHDREQFEITCYAQVPRPDAMTARFQKLADRWRSIVGVPDAQLAELISQDQIDILVDLTLHMGGNRLLVFARKPAPVQVTFAGYPGSTGLTTLDYRLSDPHLDPPGMDEPIYSEQTIRLPHSFWCYQPQNAGDFSVGDLPANINGFITFGCLNSFAKINDKLLDLWARVMRAVPSSRLLLLAPEGSHRQRAIKIFERCQVASDRIEFVPRQSHDDYLKLYHRIDVGLDSFPYNGHTTSLDSLWMGVPVITMTGATVVGRAGVCQLSHLGMRELIAESEEQFIQIAADLAGDVPRLNRLRATLRQRMEQSPLMDASGFTRDIEAAYRRMWRKWCEGEKAV